MKTLLALALLVAPVSALEARVFLDTHPGVKLTSFFEEGAAQPYALSYEGPKGHYVITPEELYSLGYDDPSTQTRYNIYRFDGRSLVHLEDHRAGESRARFSDPAAVRLVEEALAQLVKNGKRQAPEELAAGAAGLKERARRLETRRRALAAAESLAPGSSKDPARLAALEADLAASAAAIREVEAVRAEVEPELGRLIDPANPNVKASFYAGLGNALGRERRRLDSIEASLDWLAD